MFELFIFIKIKFTLHLIIILSLYDIIKGFCILFKDLLRLYENHILMELA
jgi:hypothetical protein